jgi:replication factor A2
MFYTIISDDSYVRVTGSIKVFGSKKYINATHVRPVKHFHEVMFHTLDAMAALLMMERGMVSYDMIFSVALPSICLQPGSNGSNASSYNAQSGSAALKDRYAELPPIQRKIVQFIQSQPPSDEGVHIGAIARDIGGDANAIKCAFIVCYLLLLTNHDISQ